jgi:predicted ATPase/class 3 adenylate cyclase
MDVGPCHLDVSRFHELVAVGRSVRSAGSPVEAARCFREALALWRGPALADLADRDFARVAAVRLDGARLDVTEELADAELAAGRPAAALEAVESLVPEHPFRERLRAQHMLALYRLGRQAEALAAYQDLRRTLADELGLEPTQALQALEGQILRQSPGLEGPAPGSTEGGAAGVPLVPAEPLSAGMLAFLFTDIEASSRRWEGDRAAMAADLARHDTVLREAVTTHDGHLFTHTGDGLGAAFPTVSSALAAAIAGQRTLGGMAWSGATPLRVRMAVHAGTAEARAGTFLGPTLNRTARLLDEARGGQILCSQAAADLTRDELPGGMTLIEVGERRLEGLSRPEQVWQVRHPDLPESTAPALPPATQVPTALTSFVGREAELAELAALLAEARLLTITGVGGGGKTRLALELAARTEKHYRDGAAVVELVPVRDERLLASEVLVALGVASDASSGPDATEQLCQVLTHRHVLVVLDNCEHLLEPVAALVGAVLRRCPEVTIVATSRQVLSLPGEWAWAAPGLSVPPADAAVPDELDGSDAAALFTVRARTAHPGFGVTGSNAAAVGRVCRRLDGIPLALELAAARVRVLGVTQLAERLDDRFRLLTAGPRGAPARHQTLRAAMDWSFELLPDPEQRLLRRLSIFPQSFDLEAATAVAGDGSDPILTVAAVSHEGQGRHQVAARLLGGAAGVAAALEEDPVPLPAIATLVADSRRHVVEALGSETLAQEEAAGRNTPVPALLGLALDGLDG